MQSRHRRTGWTALVVLLLGLGVLSEAWARLSSRPPGATRTPPTTATPLRPTPTVPGEPTPRPTGELVLPPEISCQEGIAQAMGALTTTARRLVGRCVALGTVCLDEPRTEAACCAGAAPTCSVGLGSLAAAVETFAERVRKACGRVPFRRMMEVSGLGYSQVTGACRRLTPPIAVENRQTLSECLARLLVEDVVHVLTALEQPRALDALLCMDVAGTVPGVSRNDPATCIAGGPPVQEPTPTPTPIPTPDDSGDNEPTPTPVGPPTPTLGPSPTPPISSPTPTSRPACSTVEVTIRSNYSQTNIGGLIGRLVYPANASIPGFLDGALVQARVTNLTGVSGLLGVSDQDNEVPPFLNFGLVTGSQPIPAGPLFRVRFDCVGPGTPTASQFTCGPLTIATSLGEESQAPCLLDVQVLP